MTETNTQPRALSPRKLEQKETRQTLNHWKTVFRNFYRRCQYYSLFLLPSTTWDQSENKGFLQETSGLKRNPETLASDLDGFLDCIASYLPFDYVAEKLRSESKDIQSVWSIIYEIYDAELTTSNYLDYASMSKGPEETYRNYFNRLVGFVRQHLPSKAVEAEGVKCPREGEVMTIGLLDAIAVHWLNSIDKRLINIIKTEFSTELTTKRLCETVKPIAKVIDELLTRHHQRDQVASLSTNPHNYPDPSSSSLETSDLIRRIEKLELSRFQPARRGSRKVKKNQRSYQRGAYCTHCAFINNQLGSSLNTDHSTNSCNKKNVSISLIDVANGSDTLNLADEDSSCYEEGGLICTDPHSISLLQNSDDPVGLGSQTVTADQHFISPRTTNIVPSIWPCTDTDSNMFSDYKIADQNFELNGSKTGKTSSRSQIQSGKENLYDEALPTKFIAALESGPSVDLKWKELDKSKSPRISCLYANKTFQALIDSGAEVNELDKDFAMSLDIGMIKTKETALAANRLPLDVFGQTKAPVSFTCCARNGIVTLQLGIMLIVNGLGTSCIIGEPCMPSETKASSYIKGKCSSSNTLCRQ